MEFLFREENCKRLLLHTESKVSGTVCHWHDKYRYQVCYRELKLNAYTAVIVHPPLFKVTIFHMVSVAKASFFAAQVTLGLSV